MLDESGKRIDPWSAPLHPTTQPQEPAGQKNSYLNGQQSTLQNSQFTRFAAGYQYRGVQQAIRFSDADALLDIGCGMPTGLLQFTGFAAGYQYRGVQQAIRFSDADALLDIGCGMPTGNPILPKLTPPIAGTGPEYNGIH